MKERSCKNCGLCERVYRITRYNYWVYKKYYCLNKEEITSLADTCENWSKKQKRKTDLSARRFDGAEEDIKEIIKLLKSVLTKTVRLF